MQLIRLFTASVVAGSMMVAAGSHMDAAGLVAHPGHLHARGVHNAHGGLARKVRRQRKCSKKPKSTSAAASASAEPASSESASQVKSAQSSQPSLWRPGPSSAAATPLSSGHHHKSASSSAASSSSSAASSSGSSNSSSSSGGYDGQKNGLAWPNGPWVNIQPYKKSMGWLYSWDATPATGNPTAASFVPDSIQFFPMLWGNAGNRIANWKKYVLNDRNAARNKAKVAMGPNEVNQSGQGEMSESEACSLFREYLVPLANDGWKLIGPSTNGAPNGITWMQNFKSQCPDVWEKIWASSTHFYGTDPQKAIKYFEEWHQKFNQPMFITETACMNYDGTAAPSLGQAYNYVKTVNSWAHSTEWVRGIAFYGVMEQININSVNRLSTSSGSPTDLFNFWVNNS